MEVDQATSQNPAPPAVDAEALVTELGNVIEQVASEPNNVDLLRRQVDLMLQLGMNDEAMETATTVCKMVFLGEALWLRILDAKVSSIAEPVTLDAFADILEVFQTAEQEYLCEFGAKAAEQQLMTAATIFAKHAKFLIDLSTPVAEGKVTGDDEVREYLNAETLRDMLREFAVRVNGLLNSSQAVWQLWIDWELSLLDGLSEAAK